MTSLDRQIEAFALAHRAELDDDDALTMYAAAAIVARVHASPAYFPPVRPPIVTDPLFSTADADDDG